MAGVERNDVNTVGSRGRGWGLGTYVRNGNRWGGAWEPTVTFLIALIILEFVAFAGLKYAFKSVHGG